FMIRFLAHVAKCGNVPYKLCSIDPFVPSYGFNFHLTPYWQKLTPDLRTQIETVSLGVNQATMTSGKYFATKNEERYKPVWMHSDPKNYAQVLEILKDPAFDRKHKFSERDRDHASFLMASVSRVADCRALNIIPGEVYPDVIEQQLDLCRDVL